MARESHIARGSALASVGFCCAAGALQPSVRPPEDGVSGGRTWWAHFEFTRINIEPTILRKEIEDLREAGAAL
jgi:hypothetical protein